MRVTRLRRPAFVPKSRDYGVSRGYGVPSKLSAADKFDLQQNITRCYGPLTAFNILFKNKDDQFLNRRLGTAQWPGRIPERPGVNQPFCRANLMLYVIHV
jgi:hypothetical protein